MLENLPNVTIMQKCAGLLIGTCLFVCLTFNSTLPLHRDSSKEAHEVYPNQTHRCDIIERTKKESILRRIKDSTQDLGKSIYDHLNTGIKTLANRDSITEDDIRQYEQLVIMKKYPYVDLKALEMKYGPVPSKNTRQSACASDGLQNEPRIHWDAADLLNVEIINRGLSGFAIPPLLAKHTETDGKVNNIVRNANDAENDRFHKRPPDRNVLESLKEDINAYIERKTTE